MFNEVDEQLEETEGSWKQLLACGSERVTKAAREALHQVEAQATGPEKWVVQLAVHRLVKDWSLARDEQRAGGRWRAIVGANLEGGRA